MFRWYREGVRWLGAVFVVLETSHSPRVQTCRRGGCSCRYPVQSWPVSHSIGVYQWLAVECDSGRVCLCIRGREKVRRAFAVVGQDVTWVNAMTEISVCGLKSIEASFEPSSAFIGDLFLWMTFIVTGMHAWCAMLGCGGATERLYLYWPHRAGFGKQEKSELLNWLLFNGSSFPLWLQRLALLLFIEHCLNVPEYFITLLNQRQDAEPAAWQTFANRWIRREFCIHLAGWY